MVFWKAVVGAGVLLRIWWQREAISTVAWWGWNIVKLLLMTVFGWKLYKTRLMIESVLVGFLAWGIWSWTCYNSV